MFNSSPKTTFTLAVLVGIAAFSAAYVALAVEKSRPSRPVTQTSAQTSTQILSQTTQTGIPEVVEKASPAVVSIMGKKETILIDFESDRSIVRQEITNGTGFIVSPDGLMVTNTHVISDTDTKYEAVMADGKKYEISIVRNDTTRDITVAKISGLKRGDTFPYLNLANSDEIKTGQTAIAIGNALGEFQNSVSVGVISGLSRSVLASGGSENEIEQLEKLIQTDAAINPGNSGGPLLDLTGKVIGVNVATVRGSENISFAIPSNTVYQVVRPYLK